MKQVINKVHNYPSNIEEKIGFDKIKNLIENLCQTEAGKKYFNDNIRFSSQSSFITKSIKEISEIAAVLSSGLYFEFPEDTETIAAYLQRIDKEGIFLYEDELQLLYKAMLQLQHNFEIIQKNADIAPNLYKNQSQLLDLISAIRVPASVLDKEGKLRMDASPELSKIHQSIVKKEKEVRKILQSKFEYAKKNSWAGDTEITIRNERLVIPIIAEHKKKIPGFVHDDSQSGKFLYIEPIECFEENNLLRELHFEKKKEIEVILRRVTAELAPYKHSILMQIRHTIFLDACRAKSIFSSNIRAVEPLHAGQHHDTHFINARHPLLYLNLTKDNKHIVPLNFKLKETCKMLVISGPNAGGKSIALKTLGLLQYMYQCGLPIPCSPDSSISIYKQIFIDIGDNQSLENNLSSYSSHLVNMKFFMEHANNDTLYLIDELGNGTDPSIGSSIAQAILEVLLKSGATGVVTTHFGNLKAWAGQTQGVQNGRMMYDLKHLEPLFVLELDKPGSSFALEVASKVGIHSNLLNRVRKINQWKQHIDLDELIAENEKNKLELVDTKKRIEEREKVLSKLIQDYEDLKNGLAENKQVILNEAKIQAKDILRKANQKIEKTIQTIQANKAEKKVTQTIRKELEAFKTSIEPEKRISKIITKPKLDVPLKVGDYVKHELHKVSGEILKIKKDQAQVLFGSVSMWMPLSELYTGQKEHKPKPQIATFNVNLFEKQSQFRAELDLRGVRGEEAIQQLDDWLHDAHLLGMLSLRIIHGRGHGILRKLINEKLKSLKFVKHFEHESEQLGGDGVTIVKID
jgi:DNA mismatch repair protein MutS2